MVVFEQTANATQISSCFFNFQWIFDVVTTCSSFSSIFINVVLRFSKMCLYK